MKAKLKSKDDPNDPSIGFSAFNVAEDCYEYIEDWCYIADSAENIKQFIQECWDAAENYQSKPVKLSDIKSDFGVSSGRFIMQSEALKRFEHAAKSIHMSYKTEPYENHMVYVKIDSRLNP